MCGHFLVLKNIELEWHLHSFGEDNGFGQRVPRDSADMVPGIYVVLGNGMCKNQSIPLRPMLIAMDIATESVTDEKRKTATEDTFTPQHSTPRLRRECTFPKSQKLGYFPTDR